MSERVERTYTLDQVVEIMNVSARATKIREEKIAKLSARLSEIEKPGHVVLPVEDVRQAVEALARAADRLHLKQQIWHEDNCGDRRRNYRDCTGSTCAMALAGSQQLEDEAATLRKHLEGQSR